MKFAFSLLLCLAALQTGCQTASRSASVSIADGPESIPTPVATTVAAPAGDRFAILHVLGMSCPLCSNNIDKQIMKIPGVTRVTVDLGSGEVHAKLATGSTPSKEQFARAVEQSGYTLDRIEMPNR